MGPLSTVSNCFIFVVIMKEKQLRDKHFLLAILAMGDLCIGLAATFAGPFRLSYVWNLTHKQLVSHFECLLKPWNIFYTIGYQLTAVISLIISSERCICVAFPIAFYQIDNRFYVKIAGSFALVFVTVSFCVAIGTVYPVGGLVYKLCLVPNSYSEQYGAFNYGLCAICGVLTAVVYLLSVWILRINRKRMSGNEIAIKRLAKQAKISKMMAVVLSAQFVLIALPDTAFTVMVVMDFSEELRTTLVPYLIYAAVLNSCMNIFFYTIFNEDLRTAFKREICRCRRNTVAPKSGISTAGTSVVIPLQTVGRTWTVHS